MALTLEDFGGDWDALEAARNRESQSNYRWNGDQYEYYLTDGTGNTRYQTSDGATDPTMFGGSEAAMRRNLEGLQSAGTDAMDLYTGFSGQVQAQQGGYSQQVQDNAAKAFGAQNNVTRGMGDIDRQTQAYVNTLPTDYGNAATLGNWSDAIRQAQGFTPSREISVAGDKLANFNAGNVAGQLGDSYSALRSYADRGMGPSAAEAQLNAALGRNVASQYALAASGRNAGENAMNTRQAMFQAADMGQKTAAEAATLRANEEAAWRGQQLQALGAASGVAGNLEQAQQGRNAQTLQAAQATGDLYLNRDAQSLNASQFAAGQYGNQFQAQASTRQAADATRAAGLQQLSANQAQTYGQTAANYGTVTDATKSAAAIGSSANTVSLSALGAGTAAQQGYTQSALDIYTGNADRAAVAASQDKNIAANAAAAYAAKDERDTDRMIGAAGSAAQIAATAYGGS